MTRLRKIFKNLLAIVAVCLPLGCGNDSPSSHEKQIVKRLQAMQTQSQLLQEQALSIESQIDEVRRASTDSQSSEIETLRVQFHTLKETHDQSGS